MKKSQALDTDQLNLLYKGILKLKTAKECQIFFRDLCTIGELQEMSERFQVVKMIDAKIPYREIADKTGVSTATITRIAHWLNHGEGGYRLILDRLNK